MRSASVNDSVANDVFLSMFSNFQNTATPTRLENFLIFSRTPPPNPPTTSPFPKLPEFSLLTDYFLFLKPLSIIQDINHFLKKILFISRFWSKLYENKKKRLQYIFTKKFVV